MIRTDSNLQPGERVVLFPSYGRYMEDERSWRLHIRGAVFDPREIRLRKRVMLRLLRRLLSAEQHQFESEIFRERIEAFVAATARGRRVVVRIGERHFPLSEGSHRCGRFGATLRISDAEMDRLRADNWVDRDQLSIVVKGPSDRCPDSLGRVHLLRNQGWSVVSDIDDTIKHTNVMSKRELLANTFLREFRVIDGMADVYQQLAECGAQFHYVSSSPWQLYVPLAELCEAAGFPSGTFHLRSFRLRDHVMRRVTLHRGGKAVEIRHLVESFPRRRFLLVGDSGERDPEIYGRLARRYPDQIAGVLIRQIDEKPFAGARTRKVVARLPGQTVRTFDNPSDLSAICDELLAVAGR